MAELAKESGLKSEEESRSRIEESLKKDGMQATYDAVKKQLAVVSGQQKDSKEKIYLKTTELVKRTNTLYNHYQ